MSIILTYVFLLFLMAFVLYQSGRSLRKRYIIMSRAGITAILVYTLNEGLRFGRGFDYNTGGKGYELFAMYGGEYVNHIGYVYLVKFFVNMGIPWQGCVMFMSFMFIVGFLFLLRNFKEVAPFALPLFVLTSLNTVENLFKWYLAFSFFMIGLSYQIKKKDGIHLYYVFFSLIAILFHVAFIPIPLVFYIITKFEKPLLSPFWSITLFFLIAFFFQSSFMLNFVDQFNALATMSDRLSGYAEDAEAHLTEGFGGRETSALPGYGELFFLFIIIIWGYRCVRLMGYNYILAYNLFLFGLLLRPITNQIPLFARFDHVFFFFRAIVFACMILLVYQLRLVRLKPIILVFVSLVSINWTSAFFRNPLMGKPQSYLYVWNKSNYTYDKMLYFFQNEAKKKSDNLKKQKK